MQQRKKYKKREEQFLYGHAMGVKVLNGNIEAALRKWKRMMKESGIIDDLKARREYTKPAAARRKKRDDAIRSNQLRMMRED